MAGAAGGDDVRAIGARLRAAREKKALTILQAAEKLHVDARILDALEAQDFGVLGADVYVRGHLRRYADTLGESPTELLELYAAGTQAVRPDLTRIPRSRPGGDSSRMMLTALLVVVGFGVAGLLWWVLTMQGERAQPVASVAGAALPAAGGPPGHEEDAQGAAPGSGAGAPAAEDSAANAAAAYGKVPAAPAAAQARLALRFSAASWVEVSAADGRRLLQGLMDAGSARTLSGASPLRVILGNAPAVGLQVNGQPVMLTGLVRRDGSAHLLVDGAGHVSAAPPRLAHGD